MFRTIPRYEETGLGLPYPVILIDAAEEELDEDGNVVGIHIPEMEGLVAAVAITRCLIPIRLSGAEVRFIRKVIGKNAKQFAEDLEMDPATYSRWENDKQSVGAWADKQVRQAAIILLREKVPHFSLDPKDVVGLRLKRGNKIPLPPMEMVLADSECKNPSDNFWDTTFKLAA